MSINKVMLFGRLGRDPELKYTATGAAVCTFSLACSEKWKDKQGNVQERTEWINIEAWGKVGELCGQYLSKGRQAIVEGKIKTDMTEKDGQKRYFTKVSALSVQFIGGQSQDGQQAQKPVGKPASDYTSEDIPF